MKFDIKPITNGYLLIYTDVNYCEFKIYCENIDRVGDSIKEILTRDGNKKPKFCLC